MPTYKRSAVTAKEGINFIRGAVEASGSLFIKIEQENDLGIDALLEFIKDEQPLNKQNAIQIKSGASYYSAESGECAFPIGSHRTYWASHPLPVFGLVYVPAQRTTFWINIKRFLKVYPDASVIRFAATEANRFDAGTFNKLFLPSVVGETPVLEFEEASRLARSTKSAEIYLGLLVLFRRYPNNLEVWEELVRTFKLHPSDEIPPVLIYWLAHIPWHGDIAYIGEAITQQTREYAHDLFAKFELQDVVKLLTFIDPEEQIGRGKVGQSVEAIISSLPCAGSFLRQVINSPDIEMSLRESAALILAMNERFGALSDLCILKKAGSWYAEEIINHVKEYGGIDPYA